MIYKYKIVNEAEMLDWESPDIGLNELGKDGWELCGQINGRLIFKRCEGVKI